jgi:Methyltransferase domain
MMALKDRVTKPIEGLSIRALRKYRRPILDGKANLGRCLICDHRTLFVESGPWLASDYKCIRCGSMPRWRAMIQVLNSRFPNWRQLQMHECGAAGLASRKFRRESTGGYSGSRYLVPDVPRGEIVRGSISCQDIEDLTFADESFDLVVTQDVLEHVLRPDRAMAEIARVLRPGGAHVFTVPISHGQSTLVRAVPSNTGIDYLLPAEYHGGLDNPERSLVIREWGDDIGDLVSQYCGLTTEIIELSDRRLGLAGSPGNPLQVLISRK